MFRRNPYEPLSEKEEKEIANRKKEIAIKAETVTRLASECLDDPKFKKYREEFEKMREDVFKFLQQPVDPDPIKDAYYLRSCINTIIILGKIIDGPKKDIKHNDRT